MQWNVEQLRSFVAAVEAGSFSGAARKLGRVQSAISTHIAMLEADFGVELFDRKPRVPLLTAVGSVLLDEAREVLRQCARLEQRALALSAGAEAELRLAVDEGLPYYTQVHTFDELARCFPHTRLHLMYGSTSEVHNWIERGDAHLAIGFDVARTTPEMEHRRLGAVQQALVVARGHPLCGETRITRAALARHRQIVVRFAVGAGYSSELISPHYWEANSSYLAADFAARGIGWAVVPLTLAHDGSIPFGLAVLEPGELHFSELTVLLIWKGGRQLTALDQWLAAQFSQALQDS